MGDPQKPVQVLGLFGIPAGSLTYYGYGQWLMEFGPIEVIQTEEDWATGDYFEIPHRSECPPEGDV